MKEYSLAKNFSKVISQLMDDLSKIFLKITLELSPCTYQAAKSLTQSQYMDSKLKNYGKCQVIHSDCWHLHASCFECYGIDVESVREEYAHFGNDNDDDANGDSQRNVKPSHSLGRTQPTSDQQHKQAGHGKKDQGQKGDHSSHRRKQEETPTQGCFGGVNLG